MSQTTLALKSIQCQVCFALTGTLVQNRIDEMWSVLDFVRQRFISHPILLQVSELKISWVLRCIEDGPVLIDSGKSLR